MTGTNRSRPFVGVVAAGIMSVAFALGLAVGSPPEASAAVADTEHQLPALGTTGVGVLCGPDGGYLCTPGYLGTNASPSAWSAYGCPAASGCPATPHHCALYVAYRLQQSGVALDWTGDPSQWDTIAGAHGVRVDQVPAVGAIAQWNAFNGHVAYVEAFDASGITLTMDWWSSATATPSWPGGYTSRVRVSADSPAWPDNFLHFRDVVGGYTLDAFGGLHPFRIGTSPVATPTKGAAYWPGWDIARGVATRTDATGGYTLDAFGGLHPFRVGNGPRPPAATGPYWVGWDIARGVALIPNGTGGYIVDGFGGIHRFSVGGAPLPPKPTRTPYWPGQDMAQGISVLPDGSGGYVTDRTGALHPFGIGAHPSPPAATGVWTAPRGHAVRGVAAAVSGTGGYTVDGSGALHRFSVTTPPPRAAGVASWPGWDIARDVALVAAT